jgi:oxygen-independent coproporphyrinogen-3 oxidase
VQPRPNATLGVYVSVPFCRAKCSFCNFASGVGTNAAIESYVEKLCAEIDAAAETAERLGAELPRVVDTIYLGGGTPSLLETTQLRKIFAELRKEFQVAADAEITMEAAPGQIADVVLEEALRLGVNRVSLGVQSFVDRECAAVGRLHTERDCVQEIRRLRAAGVAEVGADLIAGLPYQTAESWTHSLDAAIGLASEGVLTHLSVYMLEVDEDSRLGREVMAGGLRFHAGGVPADDVSAELYEMAYERLVGDSSGSAFTQYEISNFAALGHRSVCHRSRHNVKYWKREPYFGFGLDAHSMLRCASSADAVRFANADELAAYPDVSGADDVRVGEREAFEETVFLGLRMNDGISVARLRREFATEFVAPCEDAAVALMTGGLMMEVDGFWRLTLRGRMVSNEVFGALLMGVTA